MPTQRAQRLGNSRLRNVIDTASELIQLECFHYNCVLAGLEEAMSHADDMPVGAPVAF